MAQLQSMSMCVRCVLCVHGVYEHEGGREGVNFVYTSEVLQVFLGSGRGEDPRFPG